MKRLVWLVVLISAVVLAVPAMAQQQDNHQATNSALVQLLQSKGILTADEAALVNQASSPSEANQRLAQLLLSKGLITQEDYKKTLGASEQPVAADSSGGAHLMSAVVHVGNNGAAANAGAIGGSAAPAPAAPKEPPVIPAVAPLRVLPIDVPKQGGLIPDIKLGSGANLKLYGFFKASAVEDTANSGGANLGGDDFPLPLLQGDTGPTSGPEFHVKARSFRMGAQYEWVGDAGYTITGKVEYDFEGDFTNVNNRNISGVRSSMAGLRLAYARLDKKLFGDSLPWFAQFGQDWTLLGSSTLPALYETTGLGVGMGSLYERLPQFKTGVQFHTGDIKIQPEFAIVLPVQASAALTDEQRARFGDRAGSDSNQPGIEGRIVVQFPLSHSWKGVVPAQLIVSGHHARMNEIIPFANLSTASVAGATGCANGNTPATFSIRGCFPHGVQVGHPQNIFSVEAQLPTPWVTFAGKYYRGGDMRFFFADQFNDVFADLNGGTDIGTALSFSNRVIPFSLSSAGLINVASLRPVRGSGGFAELSFPLSRIFGANPEGRNAGWVWHMEYGTDRVDAEDSRRANGILRTDLIDGSIQYKINKWVSFVNEVSYIDTRAVRKGGKLFRGVDATQAHEWRNEFGTIFVF